ncbi:MAG: DUF488 domain-containing protein [Rhodobacteraceae bacterium]|nr:DUF488 domain-containing protein [Paracoccaceae bacterium]
MTPLFTIGYQGSTPDRFIATLHAAGVCRLADVRAVPLSRKPGFSKAKLATRCVGAGLDYSHLRALGNPAPGRAAARAGRTDEFRTIFAAHLRTNAAQAALRDLIRMARTAPTCLMCFERDPDTCHRSMIAAAIAEQAGFTIRHLCADAPAQYVRNAA